MSAEYRPIRPRDYRIHTIIPAGWLLSVLSRQSEDKDTRNGFNEARDALKSEGLIILDAHRSTLDIINTSIVVVKNIPLRRFIGPAASSIYHDPRYEKYIQDMEKVDGIEVHEVFRREEMGLVPGRQDLKIEYLTTEEMIEINDRYLDKARKAVRLPHQAAMIAPYGSRRTFLTQDIRRGVIDVLRTECPVICTLASPKKKLGKDQPSKLRYKVFASAGVFRIPREAPEEEINDKIRGEFVDMMQRAGEQI